MQATYIETQNVTFLDFKKQILEDYKLGRISREMSYLARREVLTGKAKFGIVGDGKELPQIAMAKVFKKGGLLMTKRSSSSYKIGTSKLISYWLGLSLASTNS
jgi:hypothetical protein